MFNFTLKIHYLFIEKTHMYLENYKHDENCTVAYPQRDQCLLFFSLALEWAGDRRSQN